MVLWLGLQYCVIVVFPDHTHLPFLVCARMSLPRGALCWYMIVDYPDHTHLPFNTFMLNGISHLYH